MGVRILTYELGGDPNIETIVIVSTNKLVDITKLLCGFSPRDTTCHQEPCVSVIMLVRGKYKLIIVYTYRLFYIYLQQCFKRGNAIVFHFIEIIFSYFTDAKIAQKG